MRFNGNKGTWLEFNAIRLQSTIKFIVKVTMTLIGVDENILCAIEHSQSQTVRRRGDGCRETKAAGGRAR